MVSSGFDDVIVKPYSIAEVVDTMSQLCGD